MLHKIIHKKLLYAEVVLISASVLIFRSAWHLLDKWEFFNEIPVLLISLILGFLIAVPTWRYILNQQDKHLH